jgi:hypothetical protein
MCPFGFIRLVWMRVQKNKICKYNINDQLWEVFW